MSITFKSTTNSHPELKLDYNAENTIQQYKQLISSMISADMQAYRIKLVCEGKILKNNQTAGQLSLKGKTILTVVSQQKKALPSVASTQQQIPRQILSTGMGEALPIGFGNYGLINHPEYMSAISKVANQEKMEEMLNDPYYMKRLQDMLSDPDTMQRLFETDTGLKMLAKQNPQLQFFLKNPQLMKTFLTPQTIRLSMQMAKNNGGVSNLLNNMNSSPNQSNSMGFPMIQSQMNMMGPQMNIGSVGMPQQQPLNNNPFAMFLPVNRNHDNNNVMNQNNNNNSMNPNSNSMFPRLNNPFFVNMMPQQQQNNLNNNETKYQKQLKQLEQLGFTNKAKNLAALQLGDGDVDRAVQYLCAGQISHNTN